MGYADFFIGVILPFALLGCATLLVWKNRDALASLLNASHPPPATASVAPTTGFVAVAEGQRQSRLQEIRQQFLDQNGGFAALSSLTFSRIEGRVKSEELDATFVLERSRDGRFKMRLHEGMAVTTLQHDGERYLLRTETDYTYQAREVTAAQVPSFLPEGFLLNPAADYLALADPENIEVLYEKTDGTLKLVAGRGDYRQTFLVEAAEGITQAYSMVAPGEPRIDVSYHDYTRTGSLHVPETIRKFEDGKLVCEITLRTIAFASEVPDSEKRFFAMH
ncbi:MAG: hypothetical protein ACFB21_06100 [Opitutales bacterium]